MLSEGWFSTAVYPNKAACEGMGHTLEDERRIIQKFSAGKGMPFRWICLAGGEEPLGGLSKRIEQGTP